MEQVLTSLQTVESNSARLNSGVDQVFQDFRVQTLEPSDRQVAADCKQMEAQIANTAGFDVRTATSSVKALNELAVEMKTDIETIRILGFVFGGCSMDALPGEILCRVVQHALDDVGDETSLPERISRLVQVSADFAIAVWQVLCRKFIMFPTLNSPASHPVHHFAWLPDTLNDRRSEACFWYYHIGPDWDDIPSLALQSEWLGHVNPASMAKAHLDLRVRNYSAMGDALAWSIVQAPQWIFATAALVRMSESVYSLTTLCLRITAHEEHLRLAANIIASNTFLHTIHLEVDSILDRIASLRPDINLNKLSSADKTYAAVQKLVIRAPSCTFSYFSIARLAKRCGTARELRLISGSTNGAGSSFQWANHVLNHLPRLQFAELAHRSRRGPASLKEMVPAKLPLLIDLSLDLPEVDARFFRHLEAPMLTTLRIKTKSRIDAHGAVAPYQFPKLTFFKIHCSSSLAARISTLGFTDAATTYCLSSVDDEHDDIEGDISAELRYGIRTPDSSSPSPATSPHIWLHSPHSPTNLVLSPPHRLTPECGTARVRSRSPSPSIAAFKRKRRT
ncbi:hypothetical protein OC846_006759 [Tilletia horrida]|uniref:Uncharacterized protein n=1 Tax=Tilletia horrida TaxID=155126 RepID=A0AAN6GI97_9BASI|nr:hypothetical protein OC846_006759 [Tilletia horrida]